MANRLSGSNMAMIVGTVDASAGTDAVLTDNDGAATLTRTAAGNYTINFVQAFNAAPVVLVGALDPVYAVDTITSAHVLSVTTSAVVINVSEAVDTDNATATTHKGALADIDFHFAAFGKRER